MKTVRKRKTNTIRYHLYVESSVCVKVSQSCPTLCDSMDYIDHGIFQARIQEWVAFPFFRSPSLLGSFPTQELNCAAAKSLQLCPTLCDPIDGSPPGSTIPGILQARTLELVAISFSSA